MQVSVAHLRPLQAENLRTDGAEASLFRSYARCWFIICPSFAHDMLVFTVVDRILKAYITMRETQSKSSYPRTHSSWTKVLEG